MIIESIVTTIGADGSINCAPMGVEWGGEVIVLKPFLETATYRNVTATRSAVVNLTDDLHRVSLEEITREYTNPGVREISRSSHTEESWGGIGRLLFVTR